MRKKYFLDTEFHESKKPVKFLGITLKEINTIDLISIGLVCEDGREYYAINKDCDIKAIWKDEWLRKNVLPSIYNDLYSRVGQYGKDYHNNLMKFNLKGMKNLLRWYGRSIPEITNDICAFIYGDDCGGSGMSAIEMATKYEISDKSLEPDFYAYFADYDWVVFCQMFGRMIDLPKGFPNYAIDLKQILDEKVNNMELKDFNALRYIPNDSEFAFKKSDIDTFDKKLELIKCDNKYPKQNNEHNALDDAKWNLKLFDFLNKL